MGGDRTPNQNRKPGGGGGRYLRSRAVTLSADGRYQKAQLLGSAPHAKFATALDKVLPTWRWELGEGSPAGCRMPAVQLMTIQFLP